MAFDLNGRHVLITGAAGLLGPRHGAAIARAGGVPVLTDIDEAGLDQAAAFVREQVSGSEPLIRLLDVTDRDGLIRLRADLEGASGPVEAVINNAAVNPTMADAARGGEKVSGAFETFPLEDWNRELNVGLTGAMLVSQVFGGAMAERGCGVIVNIASEYAVIAPDQRVYSKTQKMEDVRSFKPVSYVVAKTGLVGLTRYLAAYWAHRNVRCNALVPGGVQAGQNETLIENLIERIPMGRMAQPDEFSAALVFLCSDASAFMTGQVVVMDGGRSIW